MKKIKNAFKVGLHGGYDKGVYGLVKFEFKDKSTTCNIYNVYCRQGKITEEPLLISTATVTCKEEDTFDVEQGKLEAFTSAMDKHSIRLIKQRRSQERQLAYNTKQQMLAEDTLVHRFKNYLKNGR